jgi:hypothetical protein
LALRIRHRPEASWLTPLAVWIWRGDLCPEGGYRVQPRVSTLGTLK